MGVGTAEVNLGYALLAKANSFHEPGACAVTLTTDDADPSSRPP